MDSSEDKIKGSKRREKIRTSTRNENSGSRLRRLPKMVDSFLAECVCGGKTWENRYLDDVAAASRCDHKSSTGKLHGDVINMYGAVHIFQMIERAFVGELGAGLQSG